MVPNQVDASQYQKCAEADHPEVHSEVVAVRAAS